MRIPQIRPGPIERVIVTVSLLAAATACSFGQAPDEAAPTATPTSVPWSGELGYLYDSDFCDQIRWSDIGSELQISLSDIRSTSMMGASQDVRQIRCRVHEFDADYLDDDVAASNIGELNLQYFGDPESAYDFYHDTVGSSALQGLRLVEQSDGWWAEGYSRERVQGAWRGYDGTVVYFAYRENLVVSFSLILNRVDEIDEEGALAKVDAVARAVMDEVDIHLRCESLVDPPVPGCDT